MRCHYEANSPVRFPLTLLFFPGRFTFFAIGRNGFYLAKDRGARSKTVWNKLACKHKQVASACGGGGAWLEASVLAVLA